jgi:hypothetical protein
VLLCNGYDWDLFLSLNEVDRRSWLLDLRPPLWSYQLCAGVTRIGDPQSFGVSPLFVLVLLFGSFWGSKLAALVSAAAGTYFMARLLALLAESERGARLPPTACVTLACLFVTGNFFLWHLLVGHFNFISFYFGLGIILYTLEGYLRGLGRRQLAIATLVAWQHFSGGFFHSTVYLLVPFFIAFGLYVAVEAATLRFAAPGSQPKIGRRLLRAASFQVLGLLLASYKLVAVWQQQQGNPRTLGPANEINGLGQLLAFQLLPTVGPDWLIPVASKGHLDLHEYSAFSLLPVALAWLCARSLGAPPVAPRAGARRRPSLAWLLGIYAAFSALLVLGEFSQLAPFPLLNQSLFQSSVRAVARYGVGLSLCLAMACALLLARPSAPALGPRACTALLLLAILDVASFAWMFDPAQAARLAALPGHAEGRMSRLVRVENRRFERGRELETPLRSQMYAPLRSGVGVINCYNPLPRSPIDGWPPGRELGLIDLRHGSPSRECSEQSYFTQNAVHVAASCPPFTCPHLGALNPRDPPPGFRHFPSLRRFCRSAARAPTAEALR